MSITTHDSKHDTTLNPLTKAAMDQAKIDELAMSSAEELEEYLAIVSSQYVNFANNDAHLGFTTNRQTFSAYMATEGHYQEIGKIGDLPLIVYKTRGREAGYGILLHRGKKVVRCLKITIDEVVAEVMKRKTHAKREAYMASLRFDLDEMIARPR